MAFTTQEKERIRYHLGYMQVTVAASISFGIPRPIQTSFLVESAMDLLLVEAEPRVRRILKILDNLEKQIEAAACTLAAAQLGELTLRGAEPGRTFPDLLEREYSRWAKRLADIFGVPLYAYSTRFKKSGPGGNIPVMG